MEGQQVQGKVLVIPQEDGTSLWVSASAGPIVTPDGRQHGVVATYTDITPLHQLQEQRELFIHMVSHDLRLPLSVVQGHAQLLEEDIEALHLQDALQPSVAAIERGAQRMNGMIQDLVDSARADAGQLHLQREAVDLRVYLANLLERMRTAMAVDRLMVEVAEDVPPVSADYARLERIFNNLLTNALKYSSPETPVRIRARRQGEMVEVFGQPIADAASPRRTRRISSSNFTAPQVSTARRVSASDCISPNGWWKPMAGIFGWRAKWGKGAPSRLRCR